MYISLFEYKIETLFRYYTDNSDALQIAKNIEKMYAKEGRMKTGMVQTYLQEIERIKVKVEEYVRLCT